MTPKKKLMEQVTALLTERGQKALEIAKQSILQEKIRSELLHEALRYFMEEVWEDVLHPAILSLFCEAVGGDLDATTQVGAAMVLLAGAADVHDDIVDQSITKDSQLTVFGKFGKDISILVGDALLFKGLMMLHEACEILPKEQKKAILELVKQAFFGISSAEAEETSFRGKFDVSPEEYLDMIRTKVAVAEATAKIGVILGGGTPQEVEELGHYGRTLGILMTIRDEFVDVFELDELKNRAEKECLPLPILFTFKDPEKKDEIIQLLKASTITEKEVDRILDLVINSKETRMLKKEMRRMIKAEIQRLKFVGIESGEGTNYKNILAFLLKSTLEDLNR